MRGFAVNHSTRMRPPLLSVRWAAGALRMTPAQTPTLKTGVLVRGCERRHVRMELYPSDAAASPDLIGYCSIFAAQASTP